MAMRTTVKSQMLGTMSAEARVLLRELLRRHEHMCRGLGVNAPVSVTDAMINRSVIPYGTLCQQANVPFLTHSVGQFLNEVAEWCDNNGWPPLNALAVNGDSRTPGEGYDGAPGCSLFQWAKEVRECIAFPGYPPSSQI